MEKIVKFIYSYCFDESCQGIGSGIYDWSKNGDKQELESLYIECAPKWSAIELTQISPSGCSLSQNSEYDFDAYSVFSVNSKSGKRLLGRVNLSKIINTNHSQESRGYPYVWNILEIEDCRSSIADLMFLPFLREKDLPRDPAERISPPTLDEGNGIPEYPIIEAEEDDVVESIPILISALYNAKARGKCLCILADRKMYADLRKYVYFLLKYLPPSFANTLSFVTCAGNPRSLAGLDICGICAGENHDAIVDLLEKDNQVIVDFTVSAKPEIKNEDPDSEKLRNFLGSAAMQNLSLWQKTINVSNTDSIEKLLELFRAFVSVNGPVKTIEDYDNLVNLLMDSPSLDEGSVDIQLKKLKEFCKDVPFDPDTVYPKLILPLIGYYCKETTSASARNESLSIIIDLVQDNPDANIFLNRWSILRSDFGDKFQNFLTALVQSDYLLYGNEVQFATCNGEVIRDLCLHIVRNQDEPHWQAFLIKLYGEAGQGHIHVFAKTLATDEMQKMNKEFWSILIDRLIATGTMESLPEELNYIPRAYLLEKAEYYSESGGLELDSHLAQLLPYYLGPMDTFDQFYDAFVRFKTLEDQIDNEQRHKAFSQYFHDHFAEPNTAIIEFLVDPNKEEKDKLEELEAYFMGIDSTFTTQIREILLGRKIVSTKLSHLATYHEDRREFIEHEIRVLDNKRIARVLKKCELDCSALPKTNSSEYLGAAEVCARNYFDDPKIEPAKKCALSKAISIERIKVYRSEEVADASLCLLASLICSLCAAFFVLIVGGIADKTFYGGYMHRTILLFAVITFIFAEYVYLVYNKREKETMRVMIATICLSVVTAFIMVAAFIVMMYVFTLV